MNANSMLSAEKGKRKFQYKFNSPSFARREGWSTRTVLEAGLANPASRDSLASLVFSLTLSDADRLASS